MSKEDNGGPAFPLDFIPENCPTVPTGMALRDYFAAKAMIALIPLQGDCTAKEVAFDAYYFADAMIEAREK